MDFDSLSRRGLQFFCKRNKIPANMTNIAMADALKALETVEGIDEFMNQPDSPTSVAKNMPSAARTAARTTRRKAKEETESSELVTRSCYVTSKSLAGEMEQENRNSNVLGIPSVPQSSRSVAATSVAKKLEITDILPEETVSKTPAARSTRRSQVAASSKKDETVQRVYSTRRSVKLLEESMADLSLKTKDSIVPAKKNEVAEKEDSPEGSKSEAKSEKTEEAEIISVRDLSDSLEKEWDGLKNDPDVDALYGDLGDITFGNANTTKEQMNGMETNTVSPSDSFVLVEEQEKKQEDDFVVVNLAASTTTDIVASNKETESESESDETEYETDPGEDGDDSDMVVDSNQEAFGSKAPAIEHVSKGDSVTTVPIADESKEVESDNDSEESEPEEEEMCECDELTDNESEVPLVSDKTKPQAARFSPLGKKEVNSDSDEWSDYELDDISEAELARIAAANKNKENVEEMVVDNNGESKPEAEGTKKKKKVIDEESLKDASMRQLTKMVKEFTIKSKQHKCLE